MAQYILKYTGEQIGNTLDKINELETETWEFTLEDGSVVTKEVCVNNADA
jgi:hypothetical protein